MKQFLVRWIFAPLNLVAPAFRGFRGLVQRRLMRAAQDRNGVVAIEMALAIPILTTMLVGVMVVYDGARASQRTAEAAAIVSDLTSRMVTVDAGSAAELFATARAIAGPAAEQNNFRTTITSIATRMNNGEEETSVIWSLSDGGGERSSAAGLDLPTIPLGDSVIIAEVSVVYPLIFDYKGLTEISIVRNAVRRPRFTNEVAFNDE